jgi:uncharacterized delta-60 repeat protein
MKLKKVILGIILLLAGINLSAQTITTGTISPTTYCAGAAVSVPYTITGTFNAGNIFTAQLSDASGSFTNPVTVGFITSTSSGTINANLSQGLATGNAYRIRVVSDNPAVIGTDNGTDILINAIPSAAAAGFDQFLCTATSTFMTAQAPLVGTGTWSVVSGSATIANINSPTTQVTGLGAAPSTAVLRWTTTNGSCSSQDDVTVNVIANTGADGTLVCSFNDGDYGFGIGAGANVYIASIALQSDGKIIIGGDFTTFNGTARNRIARINADGTLDDSFNPGTGANSTVWTTTLQSDGKIILGGAFAAYNGTGRSRIARINADGTLDGSFNPGTGANGTVYTTALQSDGKIIIGGLFTTYNGTARNRIARINADGTLDISFNPSTGANSTVWTTTLQSDGKIIIGGAFTTYNGTARTRIARLNADGTLDGTFTPGTGANAIVYTTALQSDGKIIIGGDFTSYNGTGRNRIARLNADGTLDGTFNPGTGADNFVRTTALQPDGKIIIGGDFTTYNGTARNYIARLNADGTLDGTFNPGTGANGTGWTTALQSDGKIIIGGDFISYNGTARTRIARLNADGTLDGSFKPGTGANNWVQTTALQSDGKIIIGGDFTSYNGTGISRIARLNADGSLDGTFIPGTGANNIVWTTALQPDGKIIIGGNFTTYNGTARSRIARLNADGSLDGTFTPGTGANNWVRTTALQPDGKIIIGGNFTTYNGTAINYIARLNADGTLDGSFNPGTGASSVVNSTAIQSDGKIIIGGHFTSYNGTGRNYIARLNADGTLDGTFNPGTGANNVVYTTALQSDGKVIIGGAFFLYNGAGRNRIARLNADGSLDGTFTPGTGANNTILTTAIQSDGKIIIGGDFTTYNGTARNRIARSNADGTLDGTFNPGTGADNWVYTTALQPDGKIIIGGNFTSYNGAGRNYLARAYSSSTSISTSTISPTTYCAGAAVSVPYTVEGTFNAGNVFTAQLSNASGSFAAPITIGTLSSTGSGTISGTLPSIILPGSGYRIRVISSNPALIGTDNGANITINGPEINVMGNGNNIADGDNTPSTTDNTNFGNAYVSSFVDRTFSITNSGLCALSITLPITFTGTHASDFSILTPPSSSIPSGGTSSFTVRFSPAAAGVRSATININNSDFDESLYDFALQGTGVNPPNYDLTVVPVVQADSLYLSLFATRRNATLFDFGTSNFVLNLDTNIVAPVKSPTSAFRFQDGVWDNGNLPASYQDMQLGPTVANTFANYSVVQLSGGTNPNGTTLPNLNDPVLIGTIRLKIKDCNATYAPTWRTGTGSGQIQDYNGNIIKSFANFINPTPIALKQVLNVNLTASDTTICAGETVTFTVPNTAGIVNYNFLRNGTSVQSGAGLTYATNVITNGDVFRVVLTNSQGCTDTTTAVTMVVNPQDDATFSYPNNSVCAESANITPTITGTSGGTFSSTAGLVFVSTATGEVNLTASTAGTYSITYTTSGTCPASSSVSLTINPLPYVSLGNDTTVCEGGTITLTNKLSATQMKLLASDGAADDRLGLSVSISGDKAIVGAYFDDNAGGINAGSAYIYEWNGISWIQTAKLLASDGAASDEFGRSVSISGDKAIVGAYFNDDLGTSSGSAYIYEWNGTAWLQTAKLLASDGVLGDQFGWSVSISGDKAIVGAYLDDDLGTSSGSAYIYEWNGSAWLQTAKLLASDGAESDQFGGSVSISGDKAIVGANLDDNLGGADAGSAYIYEWNGVSWLQTAKILASDGAVSDFFGRSVSISGDKAIIGAYLDNNVGGSDAGSAYIYEWNGSAWLQTAKLLASDGAASDYFGWSVSISGDKAIVGAYLDDDLGTSSGSAYIYEWNGSAWLQTAKLLASDGAASDQFGGSVSISGDKVIVGAHLDDDLGASSGSAYIMPLPTSNLWSTGATTDSITVVLTQDTTIWVQVTNANGCISRDTINITVNPAPTPTVSGTTTICQGQSTTLTGNGADTYGWYTTSTGGAAFATTSSINVNPAISTDYYLEGISAAGCTSATRTLVTVTVNPTPAAPTVSGTTTICQGESTILTGNGADTYGWYTTSTGGAPFFTTASINVSPAVTTDYYLEGISAAGCTSATRTLVTVTVNPTPAAPTVSGTTTICQGESTTLTGNGANTYGWYTDPTGGTLLFTTNIINVNPVVTTSYYLEGISAAGCTTATRTLVTVTVNPTPAAPTISGTSTICEGQSTTLTGSGADTYGWYTTSTGGTAFAITSSINVNPAITTDYYLEGISSAGCTSATRTLVTVIVNPTPAAPTVSGITTICEGQSTTLTGSGADTYAWYTVSTGGAPFFTTASINVSPAITTDYYLEGISAAGCTSATRTLVTVTVNPTPAAPTVSGTTTICEGQSTTLTGSGADTYGWYLTSTGGTPFFTTASINVSPAVTTDYFLEGVSAAGCTSATRTLVTVTVNPTPAAPTVSGTTTICQGQSTTLTGNGADTYGWYLTSTGGTPIFTTSIINVSPAITTDYFLEGISAAGCTSATRTLVTVTVNSTPAAPTVSGTTTICEGQSTTLTGNGADTYGWYTTSTGGAAFATTSSINVNPAVTTDYYLEGISAAGCTSATRTLVTVTVNPTPAAPTVSGTTTICQGESTILTGNGADTYGWYTTPTGGTAFAITSSINVNPAITTDYFLEGVSAAGCTSATRTLVTVTVNPTPAAPTVSGTTTICQGQSTTLTGNGADTYGWYLTSTGGTPIFTTSIINVSPAITTDYFLEGISAAGCTSATRTLVTVTVNSTPAAPTVSGTTTICQGQSTTLTGNGADTYGWYTTSTGGAAFATTSSINVNPAISTDYYLEGISAAGCTSATRTLVTVTVNPTPAAPTVSGTTTICQGQSTTLTGSGANTYGWYTTSTGGAPFFTTASINVSPAVTTDYYLEGISAAGCTSATRTLVTVTVNPTPAAPTVSGTTTICQGQSTTLTGSGADTYGWYLTSTGGTPFFTTASINVSPAITTDYYLEGISAAGCTSATRTLVTVTVNPTPAAPMVSGTTTICQGESTILTGNGADTYGWYTTSTGGAPFFTTASINVSPAVTTDYYLAGISAAGCTSATRTLVTVTVNPTPSAPTVSGITTICQGESTTLTGSGADNYGWYTTPTGGAPFFTIGTINVSPAVTTDYYLEGISAAGCTSATRTLVTVTVNPTPQINSRNDTTVCDSFTFPAIAGTSLSVNVAYFTAPNGGGTQFLPGQSTINSGTYYIYDNNGGCSSEVDFVLTVNIINEKTITPTSAAFCNNGSLDVTIQNSDNNVKYWLVNSANNTYLAGPVIGDGSNIIINTGNLTQTTTMNVVASNTGTAVQFNGVNQKLFRNFPTTQTNNLTLEASIFSRNPTKGTVQMIAYNGNSYGEGYGFFINGSGELSLVLGGFTIQNTGYVVPANQWIHISLVNNSFVWTFYINGNPIPAFAPVAAPLPITSGGFSVGDNHLNDNPFDGFIDNVKLWNVPLTQAQVQSNVCTVTHANLVLHYDFDDNVNTSTVVDKSGNGFNGTLQNANVLADWVMGYEICNTACSRVMAQQVTVTINPTPAAPTVSGTTTICEGQSTTLTGSGADTYGWYLTSTGGTPFFTTASINVSPAVTTDYFLEGVSAAGCTSATRTLVTVTVNALPTVNAGSDQTICSNNAVNLSATANNAISVAWTTSGTGTFVNNTLLSTIYNHSLTDEYISPLNIKITATNTCGSIADSLVLTINDCRPKVKTNVALEGRSTPTTAIAGYLDPYSVSGAGQSPYRNDPPIKMLIGTIPANAIDVVKIELWANTSTKSDSAYAWLLSDNSLVDFESGTRDYLNFKNAAPGNYYVVIKHRNHLTIQSNNLVSISQINPPGTHDPSNGNFSFLSIGNIFGGGAILNGTARMVGGNARAYQEINADDLFDVRFANDNLLDGYRTTDCDLTGTANASDFDIVSTNNDNIWYSTAGGSIAEDY